MNELNPDLTLVVPCYKDGLHFEESLWQIEQTLAQTRYRWETILIDDCSPDGSAFAVEQAAEKRENARVVLHSANVGRGGTVAEGIRMARGKWVGFIDVDLEVHCRYIPSMLLALESGFDVASAYRIYEIKWSLHLLIRHILSMGYRRLVRFMLKLPYRDTETGFKFFQRDKILPILDSVESTSWFWDTEIMAQCHYHHLNVAEIPALFIRRWDKQSTVRPLSDSIRYFRELWRFRKRIREAPSRD